MGENGMLLDLKYMAQNSIPIKDFPSCKKLTELSCEDAISLSKDLVKNGIIKSGIGIIMLGKAVADGIEIVHIRQFYENMLNELQREINEEQHVLIPIEQFLIEKCNAEIGYCDIAMIKTGLKAGKEIKELMDTAHKKTVDTLLSSHNSQPYNPSIANTFFRAGEIEAWGRGIERIIMACKNDGFSTPEFRYDASGIWTIFKFEYPERATIQEQSEAIQKAIQKTIQKQLSRQQKAILAYLSKHSDATRKELCENIPNVTMGGIIHNLSRLQELGLLKRVGGRKQGYWQIVEP